MYNRRRKMGIRGRGHLRFLDSHRRADYHGGSAQREPPVRGKGQTHLQKST
jgi:hypothetical protein